MRHTRIAMVAACPFPSPQGSQVFVAQMSEQLARRGHDVHLLTYGQGRRVEDRGYAHHRVRRIAGDDASRSGPSLVKPILDILLVRRLVALLRSGPFDLMHCHNYEAALAGVTARVWTGVPVVYHSHNLMGDELPTYFERRAARRLAGCVGGVLDRTVPRASDEVIALCDYSAGVLDRCGVPSDRLSVIPPAIEDEGPGRPPRDARRALGLDDAGAWVGYCGNLDRYQNIPALLDALALLRSVGGVPVRLLLATHRVEPTLAAEVRARGLGAFTRVVEVKDWAEARLAMEAADILALPRGAGSGWPIKLLNYLSLGRPVVTGACGGKVLKHGEDGEVVSNGSPEGLAAALRHLLCAETHRDALGRNGRSRFLRDFTWTAVLPALERVYARCALANPLPTPGAHVNVGEWTP